MIIDFIRNNQGCSINKVIVYCRENKGPPKETVEKIIQELKEKGIVTERDNPHDKRSHMLTIDSENLLESFPKDLETIFSMLMSFTKLIKKIIENDYSIGNEPKPNHISDIVTYEAKRSLPFLPYYVTAIINSLYTFYFVFALPQKIENRNLIAKLHSWYFENLSKIYSFYATELGNTIYYSSDISVMVKSKIRMGYFEDSGPGLHLVYRIVRICRINGIEEQLYDVLDQLWMRNEESSGLLYALNDDDESSKKYSVKEIEENVMFEEKYEDHIKDNITLKKFIIKLIHIFTN